MSRFPIRVRLTLAFSLAMAIVLTAIGAFLYVRLGATLDERINDDLESRSAALASALAGPNDVDPDLLAGEEGVVQVIGPDGTITAASAGFEDRAAVSAADLLSAREGGTLVLEQELSDAAAGPDEIRLRLDTAGRFVTVVGEPLEDRDEALDALVTQLLVILPISVLLCAALGYALGGAALRPVETMRRRAEQISVDSPERRLPLPAADDEVRRLGETLNEMLARLDAGLARERRFVADASHELRTPLALLRAELELALRRPRSEDELRGAVRSAADETERLVELAEDLLLVTQADRGKLPVRPCDVDVRALLTRVEERFAVSADDSRRTIHVDCPDGLELAVDPDWIEQALGNLVDNAVRHGGGAIRLEAGERDGLVELHVTDEGPGFPPAFLPHAFERFSRDDDARERGGTGLGLAIVEAIAEAHGGSAHAVTREGGGADVWLVLPKRLNGAGAASRDRDDVR